MSRNVALKAGTLLAAVALLSVAASAATLQPAPVWSEGTLIGPGRQAGELVKATFTYDAAAHRLKFVLNGKTVEMTVGSKTAKINGKDSTLPVAPKVLNGATYVPLKNLFIGLGLEVKPNGNDAWIVCTGNLCIRLEVPVKPE
jgi:iron complex transport system substrate-binding protein